MTKRNPNEIQIKIFSTNKKEPIVNFFKDFPSNLNGESRESLEKFYRYRSEYILTHVGEINPLDEVSWEVV